MNWSVADQVVVSGGNLLAGVLIARFLGIEQFGVFSLLWLVLLLLQGIQSATILAPLVTIGPKEQRADAREFYYGIMLLQQLAYTALSLALAGLAFTIGSSLWFAGAGPGVTVSLLAVLVVTQINEFLRRYNFAEGRARRVFFSDVVRHGSQVGLLLAFFVIIEPKPSVAMVVWLIAAGTVLGALAMTGAWPKLPRNLAGLGALVSRQFSFSKWLLGSALMQWISGNILFLVSGFLLGPAAVGALKAAQTLLGITHIYFLAAENVVPPRAARILAVEGPAALNRFILELGVAILVATGIVGLIFSLNAEFWLTLVFGDSYAGYGYLVIGYAVGYLLLAAQVPFRFSLQAREQTRPVFNAYLWTAVIASVLSWPLVSALGLHGAVISLFVPAIATLAVLVAAHGRGSTT
jgi:O-antigen/teichoic acid export membrane protein